MSKLVKESYISAPWGKISVITWGNPTGSPILMLHGKDTIASSFLSMMGLLPPEFFYVAMDFPGYGNSDPFPKGLKLMWFYYVVAIEVVVKHFQWKKFGCIGLTMGCEYGIYYFAVYPGRIQKIVHVKPGIPLDGPQKRVDVIYNRRLVEFGENHFMLFWEKQQTREPQNNTDNPCVILKEITGKGVVNGRVAISGTKPNFANFIGLVVKCPHDMNAAHILYTFLKEDCVPKSNL